MSSIVVAGDTSGSVTLQAPAVAGSPVLTLPSSVGTGAQALITDGAGVMSWASNVALFGTGADGAVTISSGTTTLARDMHYSSLTISGTGRLNPNGWTIYNSATLDLSSARAGAISIVVPAGASASGSTAGGVIGPGYSGITAPGSRSGLGGGAGGTGAGSTGTTSPVAAIYGGYGGTSGVGGAGTPNAGGPAVTGVSSTTYGLGPNVGPVPQSVSVTPSSVWNPIYSAMFGGPGASGGGDAINPGGGGGGGAPSGGGIVIRAAVIARGSNVTAGIISATGNTGGNGGTVSVGNVGGGAGGGGSGGGYIDIVAGALTGSTITNALDVSGGLGGTGGNGAGTGKGGGGGNGGYGGTTKVLVLSPASLTFNTTNIPGTAGGGTASGTTGTAGGAGAVSRANL